MVASLEEQAASVFKETFVSGHELTRYHNPEIKIYQKKIIKRILSYALIKSRKVNPILIKFNIGELCEKLLNRFTFLLGWNFLKQFFTSLYTKA
jgi:hypothetical protein